MFGKDVDTANLQRIARTILVQNKITPELMKDLNEDDKFVLVQYLSLYNLMKSNPQQFQQTIA